MDHALPQQQGYIGAAAPALEQEQPASRTGRRPERSPLDTSNMNVALVHDYLNQYGGAERVLEAFHAMFPQAPVYTSIYATRLMPAHFRRWNIRTSFMRRLPNVARWHQLYMPLYPTAFESFDLSSYNVVLSSSSAFAKGVITEPEALHVCYCHSPMRFAWNYHDYIAGESVPRRAHLLLSFVLNYTTERARRPTPRSSRGDSGSTPRPVHSGPRRRAPSAST